jgi:hypothetical protein
MLSSHDWDLHDNVCYIFKLVFQIADRPLPTTQCLWFTTEALKVCYGFNCYAATWANSQVHCLHFSLPSLLCSNTPETDQDEDIKMWLPVPKLYSRPQPSVAKAVIHFPLGCTISAHGGRALSSPLWNSPQTRGSLFEMSRLPDLRC